MIVCAVGNRSFNGRNRELLSKDNENDSEENLTPLKKQLNDLADLIGKFGYIISNPPYGERMLELREAEDIYRKMDELGQASGEVYYKIPCGGSNALGTLGYVACAEEIRGQGMKFDHLVCAEGSGGTMAGLALGAKLFLPGTRVYGMMVDTDPFDVITLRLMREAAELLEADIAVSGEDFTLRDLCGPGYAIPSEEGNAAVELMAREEGIFLDPVYTGKAFAGLLQIAREGAFREDDRVLFLHSGGAGGLFAVGV